VALNKDRKTELITSYRTHDSDTGSPEVQVAILSERIGYLTEHFKTHAKDHTRAAVSSSWSASAAACWTT
jgi:small subunit ribosomal protein S15